MATADLIHRMDLLWDERLAAGDDLVFTVGVLKTNATAAISVIPGEVTFTVDMRSLSMETIEHFHDRLVEQAQEVARERGVRFEFDTKLVTKSAQVDEALSDKLVRAAGEGGIAVRRIASGAGHDTAVLSNAGVPSAMIFVANQNGSHNPYEEMKMEDFMQGTDVLWHAVKTFDD